MVRYLFPKKEPVEIPSRYLRGLHVQKGTFQNRPVYRLSAQGIPSSKAVLFIHGGAGMMPPTTFHFDFVNRLARNIQAPVYVVMYPLADQANAIESYTWVRDYFDSIADQHSEFYVIGDSAGANLTAALGQDRKEKIKGVVLISPACGLDHWEAMAPFEKRDILLSKKLLTLMLAHWGKGVDISDYRMNPSYVDYQGFPDTLLFYGKNELLYGVMAGYLNRLSKAGVNVTCYEGQIHCHDWPLAQMFPESQQALQTICSFIDKHAF